MTRPPDRLYLDSSVYGGAFDLEFEARTLPLFDLLRSGYYVPVYSAVVEEEVLRAPEPVVSLFMEVQPLAELVALSESADELHQAYMTQGIVGARYEADALHVALASVAQCRAIVSWNFRHIVNMDKIRLYNAVNQLRGYNVLAIHTPAEVLRYDKG